MPKVSQRRRHTHGKYIEQSPAVIPEFLANSIAMNRTTPRKVSEEDINSCSSENSISSDKRYPLRPHGQLKRPMPSVCLVDLESANASISTGDYAQSCLPPTSSFPEDSDMSQGDAYPLSAWGHFVDLLNTSISHEGLDSSHPCSPRSFLPSHFCLNAPYTLNPNTTKTKRRRHSSSARPSPDAHHKLQQSGELTSELCGLSLSSRPSSASLLKAAQDAFSDCRL